MKHVLILGAGTGGSMLANQLVRRLDPAAVTVTVVDQDDAHLYQPGLLLLPFGTYRPDQLVKRRSALLDPGVRFVLGEVTEISTEPKQVRLADGTDLGWDLLVVATGNRLLPEAVPGLLGSGWNKDVFTFYDLPGATALRRALEGFSGGRLVVHVAEMPIKCPVAPLEFTFLADATFTERGLRDKVDIVYATPLDGAFTRPVASKVLGDLLERRNIRVEAELVVERVDEDAKVLHGYGGREVPYDLLVTVPPQGGMAALVGHPLADDAGYLRVDKHSLQAVGHPDVFGLGDATNVPTSKAGAVAHFMGEVLVDNVQRHLAGEPLRADFDGHANCFIETGHGKAMLIDFSYEVEPLPGRFPLPGAGPMTLLEESTVNHLGKLAFKWMYWNLLVRGKELPFEGHLQRAGKWGAP